MPVLAVANLELSYGDDIILKGCSLSVEARERVAIVGPNGTGKSSLLKIMAGVQKADAGEISVQRGARLAYLAQDPQVERGVTLRQHAAGAFEELAALHRQLEDVFHKLADATDGELEKLLAEQARLEGRIQASGGYAVDHRIDSVLHGLGFTDAQFTLPVEKLSGGQKARLALARALLTEPDVLLMDEPTNHLDVHGRIWLEDFLVDTFKGAVVIIAHDRSVLTRVAQRVVELERGRVISYPGGYTAFRTLRADRLKTQLEAWERQQTKFRQEQAFIDKYRAGQRAKQAKGRESRLDRARESSTLEKPVELAVFQPSLPPAPRTGDIVVKATGLTMRYPREDGSILTLFEGLDITISRGERWGVVGPNGAGKSTLVECLLKKREPNAGEVKHGAGLKVGYFSQSRADMDPMTTVPRHIQRVVARLAETEEGPDKPKLLNEQESRDLAGAFLFSGDRQEALLGDMSGGERARAALAALLACARNVLVLDEPTNHLDIPSAERLEAMLARSEDKKGGTFDGTLIVVSHDRTLVDAVCDHLIVFDGKGSVSLHLGGWSEWLSGSSHALAAPEPVKRAAPPPPPPPPAAAPKPKTVKSKYSWMPVEALEERIAELEGQVERIDAKLDDPDIWKDAVKAAETTAKRDDLKAELDALETEWLGRV
ncbi:MAG: ABC-F family ATP-binding cassette domain-containing protein [Phycisphaerales bacterium JB064]